MDKRSAKIERKTNETDIKLELTLDGSGQYEINTGVGFFDHMLTHVAKHGLFDLKLNCVGDLHVDAHHTVEDVALALGGAFDKALGDKRGITRFGFAVVPMEDSLAEVAIDLCGRPCCVYNVDYCGDKVGDFDVELVSEFIRSITNTTKMNLHVNVPYGSNNHHIAEAIFKALGRALAQAVAIDKRRGDDVPSTKGTL
ncbi:MAG: imidazoleglycerol-phosphate dehydratase HisB [Sedimentisphaerales bacterium]|nr:imidazoleglycerol-phosphate dehydratase HisB [Sedimentisphaerales bacterium]